MDKNELFKIAHESYALGDGASADYWIKQANNSLLSTYNITQQVTAQNLRKDQDQNWLDYTLRLNSLSEDDIQSIGGALQILDPNELAEYTKDWDGQGVKMGIFTDILTGQAAGKFQSGDTQNPFNAFNQVFVGNTKQKIKTWNNDIETHLKSVDNLGFKGNNSLNSEIYNVIPWDKTFTPGIDYINDKGEVNDVAIDNVQNQILTVKSDNAKVTKILNNLFYDIMNIEFNLWSWIRNLTKYGDFFLKLDILDKYGIVNIHPMSPYEVKRLEQHDPENPTLVEYEVNSEALGALTGNMSVQGTQQILQNYEVAHFRLLSDSNFLPYGS